MFESFAMLKQGGLCMIPLGISSVIAATIIIERGIALRRSAVIEPSVRRLIEECRGEESAEAAAAVCRSAKGPFARIVEEVIRTRHLDHTQSIEAVNATGRTQMGSLERGLVLLEIIAGISPLLGLLGTVLGMVTVFNAIAAEGIGDPQVLSDGISKALITTVVGLCVAIPSLGFHSWFSQRVEDLATEMQDRATGFVLRLREIEKKGQ